MSWNSFFMHDLRRGLFRKRALVPAAQFFLLHFSFWLWARKLTEELTLGDFLFQLFSGVPALQKLN